MSSESKPNTITYAELYAVVDFFIPIRYPAYSRINRYTILTTNALVIFLAGKGIEIEGSEEELYAAKGEVRT